MRIKLSKGLLLIAPIIFLILLISAETPHSEVNKQWLLQLKIAEESTVLLNNHKDFVPIKSLADHKIASVNIGAAYASQFDSLLNKYAAVSSFSPETLQTEKTLDKLNTQLKFHQTIIVQLTDVSIKELKVQSFLADLTKNRQLILVLTGNNESLNYLNTFDCPIIWTEQATPASAHFTAQLIFGGTESSSTLSKNISHKFKSGDGYRTKTTRLKYTVPEELGINSLQLEIAVDHIMEEALVKKATPGAAILVAKDGKVIFNKAYGKHTYQSEQSANVLDIFDIASVTKISATTVAAMRLYEQQRLNLDENLGTYLPLARTTSKNKLKIRELMLHEAGLTPFIPFYSSVKAGDYSSDSSAYFPVKVADGYYLRNNYYEELMLPRMLNTQLQGRGRYAYSDLSMYFMKEVIEHQAMQRLDQYVLREFYHPLGMQTAGFNPRNRFDKNRIVPTEQDHYFRKTLLQGYVHDQGAAMAGGVSGHAGLFASTNDLAILFQMLLNGGHYGGLQYFNPSTINLFTSKQSATSRRGLGFDRWDPATNKYPSTLASPQTYGHTGYTGTCVWVDPKYNLVYIFLSNRVHPQVTDKLTSLRIRPRIQVGSPGTELEFAL